MPVAVVKAPAKAKPFDWLKSGVIAGCFVPFAILVMGVMTGRLSFGLELKPILNQLGYLGLVLLIASLACTPLRLLFGWAWAARLRKPLGLFGFFYIALHATVYWKSQNFSIVTVYNETLARNFILFGMLAFLLLIPLAVTSTNGMIKRLGGKRWQALHKLAYLIASLGVLHFYLRIKDKDHAEPLIWGAILAVLLAVRLYKFLEKRRATQPKNV